MILQVKCLETVREAEREEEENERRREIGESERNMDHGMKIVDYRNCNAIHLACQPIIESTPSSQYKQAQPRNWWPMYIVSNSLPGCTRTRRTHHAMEGSSLK